LCNQIILCGGGGGYPRNAYMSVLVMVAVVVDIYDGSLTVGMFVMMMAAVVVDMHDGSVDTVD
jgi:hypothetical protein